jgi:hypothetical protein
VTFARRLTMGTMRHKPTRSPLLLMALFVTVTTGLEAAAWRPSSMPTDPTSAPATLFAELPAPDPTAIVPTPMPTPSPVAAPSMQIAVATPIPSVAGAIPPSRSATPDVATSSTPHPSVRPLPAPTPVATTRPVATVAPTAAPKVAVTYSTSTPFATWEVPVGDIGSLGSPRTNVIVKSISATINVIKYLDTAQAHGQKVVLYFMDTVNYTTGTVNTASVASWVAKVKSHPALYGYLSVKEPSWNGISLAEMRSLYQAYKAADSNHPVIALLGDIPHFGTSANPWATGVANILWVDWYPVTYSRGYIATASTYFPKVRAYVDKVTPGTRIWLQVQGHGYRAGDRRTPTSAELEREVRDGFAYLKADGIVFYPWNIPTYDSDLKRNPALWSTARSIVSQVRSGSF